MSANPDDAPRLRRVLIVAFGFPPHASIGAQRPLRVVTHLASAGTAVTVLTARVDSYLPGTPLDVESARRLQSSVVVERASVWRPLVSLRRVLEAILRRKRPAEKPAGTSSSSAAPAPARTNSPAGLKTLIEELCAMPDKEIGWLIPAVWRGWRACRTSPPDVIFSTAPAWTTHLVALGLSRVLRRPWVADFRDPWVRSPWIRYRTPLARSVAARLEALVVRRAASVVFTTEAARDEFSEYYHGRVPRSRFRVVANGCDPTEFDQLDRSAPSPQFVVLHAGSLYGGRSPVPLLEAAASLCRRRPAVRDRLRIKFLGSVSLHGVDLDAVRRGLGLEDVVEFAGRVSRPQSLRAMREASALLLLQSGTAMAIPAKLYEYLASQRPILALCEPGEITAMIERNNLGVVAPPADPAAIENGLAALIDAPAGAWTPAPRETFDGRLRAAEMAAIFQEHAAS